MANSFGNHSLMSNLTFFIIRSNVYHSVNPYAHVYKPRSIRILTSDYMILIYIFANNALIQVESVYT